jgi:hypothetical protein
LNEFYKISSQDIVRYGGRALLEHVFDGSLASALQSIYPNHNWIPSKFEKKISRRFWDRKKQFMNLLSKEFGIKQMDDWYKITTKNIEEKGGNEFLSKFNGSPFKLIQSTYPNHPWLPWRFSNRVPLGFWEQEKNCMDFMEWLGKELKFNKMEDWYKITLKNIQENGATGLVAKYGGSPSKLVQAIYPQHQWILSKFDTVPRGYWSDKENQKNFMDWLGKELGFEDMDDWYNISLKDLEESGARRLLDKYNSLFNLVSSIYPERRWNKQGFALKLKW